MLVYVGGYRYNTRMTTKWTKYSFVCNSECDALIEYTLQSGYTFNDVTVITCACGSDTTCVSVEDATIQPTTTKEDKMETTYGATVSPVVDYNPNLLVTYKIIRGYADTEYRTDKVSNIEYELHNGRDSQKKVNTLNSNINSVRDIILETYANSDDQETLRAIAEVLGIELTRTVEWAATIEVSGTIELDLLADEDTDIESEITDAIYADSNHGNITIDDTEVCNVREC